MPHEWTADAATETLEEEKVVRDSNGNHLTDGDSVSVIKDLKVIGSSSVLKMGTKVKNTDSSKEITTSTAKSTASEQ